MAFLIDIDGVMYQQGEPVPGAAEAVQWLADRDLPYLFVTNTTSQPRRVIAERLQGYGVPVTAGRILTPPVAARRWLAEHANGPALLLVPEPTREDFGDLVEFDDDGDTPAAVVVGDIGDAWDYPTLNRAFRLLMSEPAPVLVALGLTRYWRAEDGLRLDVAPFVRALECAADCTAVVLGKPSGEFFAIALEALGCAADEAVMLGDDIRGDVAAAQDAGIRGILVRTGKFRPADLERGIEPDAMLDSLADLPDWCATQPGYEG